MTYAIVFAESVKEQLLSLKVSQRGLVLDAIETHLAFEPLTETRNRKRLRPNPVAPWELRVRSLRVFYDVALDDPKVVRILAVGRKAGNRLIIGGKVVEL